jgi:NAD(P)-dependent dehydrogenase (short-subunit alcohol dehydrogenase family)
MKTVVITGISRGIGQSLSEKFLAEGYFVIGTSTTGTSTLQHENLITLQLDLSKTDSIEKCVNQIKELKRPIDILINNAGTYDEQRYDNEFRAEGMRRMMEVNLFGPVDFTELLISNLAPGAHVVNVSSRQGSMSYPPGGSHAGYKVSKAGLNMFTRILSHQLKDKATVSSVHPGAVKTDMGASDANMEPEEAAKYIYELAISKPETGQFWFKGEKFPW